MSKKKEPKYKLKKGKEYNLNVDVVTLDSWGSDWEWNKIFTGMHPEHGCYMFTNIYGRESSLFEDEIIGYGEPVSATEMFQMHTNYMNFYRKGALQDLRYAQEIRQIIINTLKERRYIIHGSGKFEPFDYRLMHDIRNDIDSGLYHFEVGETYQLQNGDSVTIIARDHQKVLGSDNIWRYDVCDERIMNMYHYGLCIGSSWEFIDAKNIINDKIGNRHQLIQDFKAEYGYSDKDIKNIGKFINVNDIYQKYLDFLKDRNIKYANQWL